MKKQIRKQWSDTHAYRHILPPDAKVWLDCAIDDVMRNQTKSLQDANHAWYRDLVNMGTDVAGLGVLVDFENRDPANIIDDQATADTTQKCLRCRERDCKCMILRDTTYLTDDYIKPMYNEGIALRNALLNTAVQQLQLGPKQVATSLETFSVNQLVIIDTFQHLDTYKNSAVLADHAFKGKRGTIQEYCPRREQYSVKVWDKTSYVNIWLGAIELKGAKA
jgi:hypothetical protein